MKNKAKWLRWFSEVLWWLSALFEHLAMLWDRRFGVRSWPAVKWDDWPRRYDG